MSSEIILTTLRPKVGYYNIERLYINGVEIQEFLADFVVDTATNVIQKAIADGVIPSTGTTAGTTSGSGTTAASSVLMLEQNFVAKQDGIGFNAGDLLRRYEVTDLGKTPIVTVVVWYNQSREPAQKLTGSPVNGAWAADHAYSLGTPADLRMAEDGTGNATVIAALKAMVVHLNSTRNSLTSLQQKLAPSGSTDPLLVKIATDPVVPAPVVLVEEYDAIRSSSEQDVFDILSKTTTTTGTVVSELWRNTTKNKVLANPPTLISIQRRGMKIGLPRTGSKTLATGQFFSGRKEEIREGILITGVCFLQKEGSGTVSLTDSSTIALEEGDSAEIVGDTTPMCSDFVITCLNGKIVVTYTYYITEFAASVRKSAAVSTSGLVATDASGSYLV
jgi:hypothetical protein